MLARFLPHELKIDFVRKRFFAFALTGLLAVVGIVSLAVQGLHFGIDFRGGILIEAAAKDGKPIDFGALRTTIGRLGIGDAQIQQSGPPSQVAIRVANPTGDEAAGQAAVRRIQETLGADKYEFRRVEYVGPKVSSGLFIDGMVATGLALLAIAIYVGVRFEWQFGVAALIATGHDVFMALMLYSVFGFEFDLVAVAALLTLAGYSINDTIVVFDRLRENMRKFKRTDFKFLINVSTNQMLVRTMLTSATTVVAVLPMLIFGGEALFNFTVTIVWGIVIGTYSSVYVAASLLIYLPAIRQRDDKEKPAPAKPGKSGLAAR